MAESNSNFQLVFSTNISQGSVVTRLRCGETFYDRCLVNFPARVTVKEFENCSISLFDEVKTKIRWFTFLTHGVYAIASRRSLC